MSRVASVLFVLAAGAATWYQTHSPWLVALVAILIMFAAFVTKVWAELIRHWAERVAGAVDRRVTFMFSGYRKRYAERLYYKHRTFDVKGFSTQGKFALELETVYVNLAVEPASAASVAQNPIRFPDVHENASHGDILAWLRAEPGRLGNFAILGPPGSGKTTILKHLALLFADGRGPMKLTPVLLFPREHFISIGTNPAVTLPEIVDASLQDLPAPIGWFAAQLRRGNCIVMFDGLDEVTDPELRNKVALWVDREVAAFPGNRFLASARPNGYRNNPLTDFTVLRVLPFNREQVEQFVYNWYFANELLAHQKDDPGVRAEADRGAKDLLRRISEFPTLNELAVNPLLLTLIATVHRFRSELPTRRVELFAEICDVSLGRRQLARGLEMDLTPRQKARVLGKLAYEMMRRHVKEMSSSEADETIAEVVRLVAPRVEPLTFLSTVENSSGLLVQQASGIYGFAHLSFQEYLASVHIRDNNIGDDLINWLGDAWWQETILLYAAQADATKLVQACLGSHPPLLDLAARITEEALEVQGGARKQPEADMNVQARSMTAVEEFISAAGFAVTRTGDRSFSITAAKGRLGKFVPIPVRVALDEHFERDIVELAAMASSPRTEEPLGILIHDSNPDALSRIKIADVRLRNGFFVIPLSLRALEKALANPSECFGLLQEQSLRYLPGADLFDDKTAIADTFTFYGRAGLLNEIQNDLVHSNSVGLFGLRKSGKTSVLLQLAAALRAYPVIHCDLQKYGASARFGADLFNEILRRLTALVLAPASHLSTVSTPFSSESSAAEVAPEFVRRFSLLADRASLAEYHLPVVCLFDEIERILPLQEDNREKALEFNTVFGTLRSICQSDRRLVLVATDVHPDCNRTNVWPQRGVGTNPIFAFFKEVFLRSFSEEDTRTMLSDIARLMGRSFDEETLRGIHVESGGHPFLARQLASLVCRENPGHTDSVLQWASARQYVECPFIHSGFLRGYFAENLWEDLERRDVAAALDVLRLLGSSGNPGDWFAREALQARLQRDYSEDDCSSAILMLEEIDIVSRQDRGGLRYRLQIPLFARWLRLRMKQDEIARWQIN